MESGLEKRIRELIAEQLGLNVEQISSEAHFINDLGADSLDLVELIMAMEDALGIEIPDDDAQKLTHLGAVIAYISDKNVPALDGK